MKILRLAQSWKICKPIMLLTVSSGARSDQLSGLWIIICQCQCVNFPFRLSTALFPSDNRFGSVTRYIQSGLGFPSMNDQGWAFNNKISPRVKLLRKTCSMIYKCYTAGKNALEMRSRVVVESCEMYECKSFVQKENTLSNVPESRYNNGISS